MAPIALPTPPKAKGKDAMARWMAIVSFTLGMSCLVGHQIGFL